MKFDHNGIRRIFAQLITRAFRAQKKSTILVISFTSYIADMEDEIRELLRNFGRNFRKMHLVPNVIERVRSGTHTRHTNFAPLRVATWYRILLI